MALTDERAPIPPVTQGQSRTLRQRGLSLMASRSFQKWAARFPLTRGVTRREGDAIMDLVAGFVHSQCLSALVRLNILDRLMDRPLGADALALATSVPKERLEILLAAGISLGLLREKSDVYTLTRRGAALTGVPGLGDMVRHHEVLYRDLADPVAFFKGETDTELARFWPYVFGAAAAEDPETADRYSHLMTESQTLVAEDTLELVSFADTRHIMDIGGGTGAFLRAVLTAHPDLQATLFDLPAVVRAAHDRFATDGLISRVEIKPGSFRDDPLPEGADMISLVRVLYDHADETVAMLLAKVHAALPPGGRIVISEPMAGSRAGDGYFAIYTLAMQTGRTRSPGEISECLAKAGFVDIAKPKSRRSYVTSVVTARKADT